MNALFETLTQDEMRLLQSANAIVIDMDRARELGFTDEYTEKYYGHRKELRGLDPEVDSLFWKLDLSYALRLLSDDVVIDDFDPEFLQNHFFEIIGGDKLHEIEPLFPDGQVTSAGRVAIALCALRTNLIEPPEGWS